MDTFNIKQNNTSPAIEYVIADPDGEPVDLTDAKVDFVMEAGPDENVIDAAATVDIPEEGVVYYHWTTADTVESGLFRAEWRVTFPDNSVETFPNVGYLKVYIAPKV